MWVSILDDLNLNWEDEIINTVIKMWNRGETFQSINDACIGRNGDEVFLLLLHLARRNKIKYREGYIWGTQ